MWKSPVRGARPRGLEYWLECAHPRSVENTRALSSRRGIFLDERGTGLRVTWHPERDLVVLSVWQDDRCVGTFRLSVHDVPRLSGLLAAALGDWVGQTGSLLGTSDPGTSDPEPSGSGSAGSGPGVPEFVVPGSASIGTVALDSTDPGARAGREAGRSRSRERQEREYRTGGSGRARGAGPAGGAGLVGGSRSDTGPGTGSGAGEHSLSVQQRLRLSRPVLKLRGLQDRRRRAG
jgi:hypothetical protein